MDAGVRNKFAGEIVDIREGEVMSQVVVKSGSHYVTSVMTTESLHDADFNLGDTVTALAKAINVVLVK